MGIFRTWADCEQQVWYSIRLFLSGFIVFQKEIFIIQIHQYCTQVKGFSGAVYKSFKQEGQAKEFVAQHSRTRKGDATTSTDAKKREATEDSTINNENVRKRPRTAALEADSNLGQHNPFGSYEGDLTISISFDGGSRGNPGVAGCGAEVVVINSSTTAADGLGTTCRTRSKTRLHRFLQGSQTNNRAEYWGLITGLECTKDQLQAILTHDKKKKIQTISLQAQGDSKLVVEQLNGAWKVGSILQTTHRTARKQLKEIQDLCKTSNVALDYSLRHVYRSDNKIADGEYRRRLRSMITEK